MIKNQSKLETIEACYTTIQLLLRNLYIEWLNDYIGYSLIAEHKGLSEATITAMIKEGRAIHEDIASLLN